MNRFTLKDNNGSDTVRFPLKIGGPRGGTRYDDEAYASGDIWNLTGQDATAIIEFYEISERVPRSVRDRIQLIVQFLNMTRPTEN